MAETVFTEERHGIRKVHAMDDPGSGNAHHYYHITHQDNKDADHETLGEINFQKGPILEAGVNGVHNEDLLHIVKHRLECFQSGPFKCDENQRALDMVAGALISLSQRTNRRVAAGTEGTHKGN